jgi:predicted protein tyrosine phosphatase
MIIHALSRATINRTLPSAQHVVISLYTPGDKPVDLPEGWALTGAIAVEDSDKGFTESDMSNIHMMVEYARQRDLDLIVQCDMGVSRSVGVARAISDSYQGEFRHLSPGNTQLRTQLTRYFMRMQGVL